MMKDVSSYRDVSSFDSDLQMFREAPKLVDVAHLEFLRWLIEHGRLDHPSALSSSDDLDGEAEPTLQ
jgi:hypothetical protein